MLLRSNRNSNGNTANQNATRAPQPAPGPQTNPILRTLSRNRANNFVAALRNNMFGLLDNNNNNENAQRRVRYFNFGLFPNRPILNIRIINTRIARADADELVQINGDQEGSASSSIIPTIESNSMQMDNSINLEENNHTSSQQNMQ